MCSKIDFDFLAKGHRDPQRQPFYRDIELSCCRSMTCDFCALVQHCLDQNEIIDSNLLGNIQGVHSGQELHLYNEHRKLEYSIRQYQSSTKPKLDRSYHVSERSVPTELVDWLEKCDNHGCLPNDCNSTSHEKLPQNFRLIDVERRRTFKPRDFVEYRALSYVWGSINQFFLTKESEKELECDEGLTRIGRLPQTILDAMSLCKEIGCRYLWVDSLCIIQNDDLDRHHQICSMAEIYSRSYLTIIAAAGADANSGLPPYGKYRRLPQMRSLVVNIPGRGSFIASRSPQIAAERIGKSIRASRAWTLQEQILSRRVLFFTGAYTFLRCEYSLWIEDSGFGCQRNHFKLEDQEWDLPLPAFYRRKSVDGHIYSSTFKQILGDYLRRQQNLTIPADILNAITGILVRLKSDIGDHIWGLPSKRFAAALLWKSGRPSPGRRRSGFPSWSWAGWLHEKDFDKSRVDGQPHDIYGDGADDDATNQSALYCWGVGSKKQEIHEIEQLANDSIYQQLKNSKWSMGVNEANDVSSPALLDVVQSVLRHPPAAKLSFEVLNKQIQYNPLLEDSEISQNLLIWGSCATLSVDQNYHSRVGASGETGRFFLRVCPAGVIVGVIDLALEWRESESISMQFLAITAGVYPSTSVESFHDVRVRVMMVEPVACSTSDKTGSQGSFPCIYRRIQVSLTGISLQDWAKCKPESKFVLLI